MISGVISSTMMVCMPAAPDQLQSMLAQESVTALYDAWLLCGMLAHYRIHDMGSCALQELRSAIPASNVSPANRACLRPIAQVSC